MHWKYPDDSDTSQTTKRTPHKISLYQKLQQGFLSKLLLSTFCNSNTINIINITIQTLPYGKQMLYWCLSCKQGKSNDDCPFQTADRPQLMKTVCPNTTLLFLSFTLTSLAQAISPLYTRNIRHIPDVCPTYLSVQHYTGRRGKVMIITNNIFIDFLI